MNIKKIIYNLFFKKKRKSSGRKNTQKMSSENRSSSTSSKRSSKAHKGNYDTSLLRQQVSETEYISNLRIGRSWILPQMVKMGFIKGYFDIQYFEKAIREEFDVSQTGRRKVWTLMKRNYKVIADSNGTSERNRWWTKEVLLDVFDWDFNMVGKRSRGLNRKECIKIIATLEELSDPQAIYQATEQYDACRMRTRAVDTYDSKGHARPLPESFINAFMGDGAYNAMMTMVKVLDIRITKEDGSVLSREECISEIEERATILSGRELLEYCKETFFDSGAFEYKKYIKKK